MKHFKQEVLKSYIQARVDTYIYGPTGSSKTTSVQKVAEELGLAFYKKLISAQMTESNLLGYMDAQGRYVEGIAYKPYKYGGILTLDEIDNGNPNTNTVINGLSDNCMAFPCGMITKHPDCVLVATANTLGGGATISYVGRNKLDAALLNRFPFIEWPYDSCFELQLAINLATELENQKPITAEDKIKCNNNVIKHYIDFIKLREAAKELKLPLILSSRNFLQAIRLMAANRNTGEILNGVFLKGLNRELAENLIKTANNIKSYALAKLPLYQEMFNKYEITNNTFNYVTEDHSTEVIAPLDTCLEKNPKIAQEFVKNYSTSEKSVFEVFDNVSVVNQINNNNNIQTLPKITDLLDTNPFNKQVKKKIKSNPDVTYSPAPLKENANLNDIIEQGLR